MRCREHKYQLLFNFSKKVKPKCLNNTKINAAAINFMDCRHKYYFFSEVKKNSLVSQNKF